MVNYENKAKITNKIEEDVYCWEEYNVEYVGSMNTIISDFCKQTLLN